MVASAHTLNAVLHSSSNVHLRVHACAFVCVQMHMDLCIWMRLLFKDFCDVLYMYLDVGRMYGGHTLSKTTCRYSECATDHTTNHRVAEQLISEGLGNISQVHKATI